MTEDYQRFDSAAEQGRKEAYRTSTPEMKADAEKRAYETRYPFNPHGDSSMRVTMNQINREAWAAMPEEKKLRLIQDEMKINP